MFMHYEWSNGYSFSVRLWDLMDPAIMTILVILTRLYGTPTIKEGLSEARRAA